MTLDRKSELSAERAKLHKMLIDAEVLQKHIARQKRVVAALTELVNIDEDSPAPTGLVSGITDAVRTVIIGAEKPLNPAEIESRVRALGVPPQQNLLASVHTILRRLLQAGQIEPCGDMSYGGGYRWKSTFWDSIAESITAEAKTTQTPRKTIGRRIAEAGKK